MLLLYILCIKTKMWKKLKHIELYMITISCESHYAKCFLFPFILLFSPPSLLGLRGAIPYALSLHLGLEPIEKRQLIGTTTIIIVLFTILFLGGGTMPLIRIMDIEDSQSRRKNKKDVNLSKTQKMVMIEAPRVLAHGFVVCIGTSCAILSSAIRLFLRTSEGKNIKGLIVKDTESVRGNGLLS